ncbi:branched-chain amino acid ABC transporter permease [Actinacidiphila sp. ITFR-21]|uniref:branched-chain amino acid ABC transporter permease n=1 Tax=Actinacidiphila sp. ITFR-21 TaxID=3075199 RepID=UPI00288AB093|nr:branched-chain amino acid ABC transporter permease [Streptomyces sp. ITFR-21]WNI18747.1 branched-chain amino acid ABC transporter permease [Streptomyces sp. ITFR-21]
MTGVSILNALAISGLYVLVVTGLAIIYGLRGVMNFSHGALYMVGGYFAYTLTSHMNFWVGLVGATVIMGLIGILFEFVVLRPLMGRLNPTLMALVTFGLSIIIDQVIVKVYGGGSHTTALPSGLQGTTALLGTHYPTYRLFVIGVAVAFSIGLFCWLRYSRTGMYVRAFSQDPGTSEILGVNSDRIGLLIVSLGMACAGLAGALAGPYITVSPSMGDSMVITALIIVVVGGVGSLGGAFVIAIVYGFVQTFGAQWVPSFSSTIPYLAAFIALIAVPRGLGRSREA